MIQIVDARVRRSLESEINESSAAPAELSVDEEDDATNSSETTLPRIAPGKHASDLNNEHATRIAKQTMKEFFPAQFV